MGEDVDAEAKAIFDKSFGTEVKEQVFFMDYHETPEVSVWCAGPGLQMFSNIPEETAKNLAQEYFDTHIYFFAELSVEE